MKFGISLVPDSGPGTKSAATYYDEVVELSEIADAAGLEWVKMTEHYIHPYGGYCPSPLTFLAAVAARTRRIRLLTGGVLPVFHHPIELASHAAMVDVLSGGRLDLGATRGYMPYEFDAFGVAMDGSRKKFDATMAAIRRLFTEENVTEDTPYFAYDGVTLQPHPIQRPHPPMWVAASRNLDSFAYAGQHGYGLLASPLSKGLDFYAASNNTYREAYAASGHPGTSKIVISLPVFVADTDAEAFRVGDALFAKHLDIWVAAAESWSGHRSTDYPTHTDMGAMLRSRTATEWRESGSGLFGCPERVADQIRALQQASPVEGLIGQVDFGGVSGVVAQRSLRLFIDKVIPALGDL